MTDTRVEWCACGCSHCQPTSPCPVCHLSMMTYQFTPRGDDRD